MTQNNNNLTVEGVLSTLRNMDAENAVLGAVMRKNALLDTVDLSPEMFGWQAYGKAWGIAQRLHAEGKTADAVTIGDELEREGYDFQTSGTSNMLTGRAALSQIRGLAAPQAAETYAEIVRDYYIKRKTFSLSSTMADWAANGRRGMDIVNDAQQSLAALEVSTGEVSKWTATGEQVAGRAYDSMERASKGELGLTTGLTELDNFLSIYPKDLVYVAARPGQGKTGFLIGVIRHALKKNRKVLFYSLEMGVEQIGQRIIAQETGINLKAIRDGKPDDWGAVTVAMDNLSALPLYVNEMAAIKIGQMRREARRMKARYGIDLVIVDYVQLSDSDDAKSQNRNADIEKISRGLKAMAKELDLPVIAAAQLNRSVEQRADKRPMLSDLRDSGSLEQDADAVVFIYRPDQYEKDAAPGTAELIAAKQRNGPCATARVCWLPETAQFVNGQTTYTDFTR